MTANFKEKKSIFLIILVQTMTAICGGLLGLYLCYQGTIPDETYVNDINIGGLNRNEAEKKVEESFSNIQGGKSITIRFNKNEEFKIKFDDIDAVIDAEATIDQIFGRKKNKTFITLIESKFFSRKRILAPQFSLNGSKLNGKFFELSKLINKEPVNANIYVLNDKIIKVPEIIGCKLNIINASKKVRKEMGLHLNSPIDFDLSGNFEVESVPPQYTIRDFDNIDEVISSYSTDIASGELIQSIRMASDAINKVLLQPEDKMNRIPADELSFNKCLSIQDGLSNQDNEGFNQVASTLYAALLLAGVREDNITRTPHPTRVEYIEDGLDVRAFGNLVDFKFKNTMKYPLMIFSQVKDNKIKVNIAGKKKDGDINYRIATDIVQKYDSPVISVETKDLPKGEKKLISSGKQGVTVNVYLITVEGNSEIEKRLLHTDTYQPIKAVMQIGSNTNYENPSVK